MQDPVAVLKETGNCAVEIDRHDVGPAPAVSGQQGARFAEFQTPQQPVVQAPQPKPAGLVWLKEVGFTIQRTLTDSWGYYSVTRAKKA